MANSVEIISPTDTIQFLKSLIGSSESAFPYVIGEKVNPPPGCSSAWTLHRGFTSDNQPVSIWIGPSTENSSLWKKYMHPGFVQYTAEAIINEKLHIVTEPVDFLYNNITVWKSDPLTTSLALVQLFVHYLLLLTPLGYIGISS